MYPVIQNYGCRLLYTYKKGNVPADSHSRIQMIYWMNPLRNDLSKFNL